MPLDKHLEFLTCLRLLAADLKEDRANFLLRPPMETLPEEAYSRGLLQGKEDIINRLVELAKQDLMKVEEEENEHRKLGPERYAGDPGGY